MIQITTYTITFFSLQSAIEVDFDNGQVKDKLTGIASSYDENLPIGYTLTTELTEVPEVVAAIQGGNVIGDPDSGQMWGDLETGEVWQW